MAERKEKKSRSLYRLGTALLAVLLVFYVGYQAYRGLFGGVKTELVTQHSVYESIDADGLVFRTETLIPAAKNGYVYYTVENGTRVAKNGVIASVYPTAEDGRLEQQMSELDQQIAALKSIQTEASSGRLTLDMINSQLLDTVNGLVLGTEDGLFSSVDNVSAELLSLMSKKYTITGGNLDLKDTIARLLQEKETLAAGFHKAISSVQAPVAGYFADKVDGYEDYLKSVSPESLTVDKIQELLAAEPPVSDAYCGKIVGGYEWFFACVVPESYYNSLVVGTNMSLRMSFVTDEEIPVTVVARNKNNNGQLAVVFRCAYMSEELSTIRRETAQIQLVKHTGLRVPKRAIVIGEDMEAGVYVRSGNVVSFRKIDQVFSEPADYVICSNKDEKGWLHLYDDVIVGGKGLYDGKIIR